jgi:hypothetical protein
MEGSELIYLDQDRNQWRAVVNTAMNLRVTQTAGKSIDIWVTMNFWITWLYHEASWLTDCLSQSTSSGESNLDLPVCSPSPSSLIPVQNMQHVIESDGEGPRINCEPTAVREPLLHKHKYENCKRNKVFIWSYKQRHSLIFRSSVTS